MAFFPSLFNGHDIALVLGASSLKLCLEVTAKYNIGSSPGHIGGNRHCRGATSVCNNVGFTLVLFRIQHTMAYATPGQFSGQQL